MNKNIDNWYHDFKSNSKNIKIMNNIKEKGVLATCLNKSIVRNNKKSFNLTTPRIKSYNQKKSNLCWIYSGLKTIIPDICRNMNIKPNKLSLSPTYISFFDRLEKINEIYNQIINDDNNNLEKIIRLIESRINSCGTFNNFMKIINKYGLVPIKYMPDFNDNYDYNLVDEILSQTVKINSLKLIEIKNISSSKEALFSEKEKIMQEMYDLLCKLLGQPPIKFSYTFKNNNKNTKIKNISPFDFASKFLTLKAEDFITVTTLDINDFFNSYSYFPNLYMKPSEKIKKLSVEDINSAIIKQLKAGIPIWFSAEISLQRDKENGILHSNVYKFKDFLNINEIDRNDAFRLGNINYDHAMAITGVNILNGKINRYRVDDSLSINSKNDHIVMYPNYFNDFIITLVFHKNFIDN